MAAAVPARLLKDVSDIKIQELSWASLTPDMDVRVLHAQSP